MNKNLINKKFFQIFLLINLTQILPYKYHLTKYNSSNISLTIKGHNERNVFSSSYKGNNPDEVYINGIK